MRVEPPTATKTKEGWVITVKQLGANYKFGPFRQEDCPAEMEVFPIPIVNNQVSIKEILIGTGILVVTSLVLWLLK